MKIEDIEKHRMEKVESLLLNRVDYEINLLNETIAKHSYSEEEKKAFSEILEFAMAQDYGEKILYKYYIAHPIRTTRLILYWLESINEKHFDLVQASLVHNALEKKILSPEELEERYGYWTRNTIEVITVDREDQKRPGWATDFFRNILTLDKYGQMLKVFDKFDNIYTLGLNPDSKIRETYLNEIRSYIQPMLNKYAPDLSEYFEELIKSTEQFGHKSIETYLAEFAQRKE